MFFLPSYCSISLGNRNFLLTPPAFLTGGLFEFFCSPPNVRKIISRCEERDDPWENIPQEDDCTSEMSEDTSPSQADIPREVPLAPPQTHLLRRQGDLPAWQDLIGSSLEELAMTYPDQYEGADPTSQNPPRPGTANTQETLKLMHTLTHDPEGRQTTNTYFDALNRSGYGTLATDFRFLLLP